MKSYNNLWKQLISDENIILAERTAGKGKNKNNRRHKDLRRFRANPENYIEYFRNYAENYNPKNIITKVIKDGSNDKERIITIPISEDVVLQNMIVNVLKSILIKGMYEHSYACIDGRGTIQAVKVIKKVMDKEDNDYIKPEFINYKRRNKKSKVSNCFKADISKFFNSIDQDNLIKRLNKIIRDKKFMNLLKKIIKSVPQGLALGYATSHWLANWLLTPLDHYIKEELKVPYYFRFVDDIVLFDSSKRRLHYDRNAIENYLQENYNLTLKPNWQIFPLSNYSTKVTKDIEYKRANNLFIKTKEGRFLDFLGYKFHRVNCLNNTSNRITIRKSNAKRIKHKAKHINNKKDKVNIYDVRQMITYVGMCKYANCFKWFYLNVLSQINISKLRNKISNFDKLKIAQLQFV